MTCVWTTQSKRYQSGWSCRGMYGITSTCILAARRTHRKTDRQALAWFHPLIHNKQSKNIYKCKPGAFVLRWKSEWTSLIWTWHSNIMEVSASFLHGLGRFVHFYCRIAQNLSIAMKYKVMEKVELEKNAFRLSWNSFRLYPCRDKSQKCRPSCDMGSRDPFIPDEAGVCLQKGYKMHFHKKSKRKT